MNISRINGNVGFNGLIRLANRDNRDDQRLLDTDNIRQIIQRNDDIIMINTKDDIQKKGRDHIGQDKSFVPFAQHASSSFCCEAINAMTSLVRVAAHEADRLIETRIRPNNWLKLHGYPMRRKGKGRKRK